MFTYVKCEQKRTGPFVISSHLCFDSYKFHDNFQRYIGLACCEDEVNVYDSLTMFNIVHMIILSHFVITLLGKNS